MNSSSAALFWCQKLLGRLIIDKQGVVNNWKQANEGSSGLGHGPAELGAGWGQRDWESVPVCVSLRLSVLWLL